MPRSLRLHSPGALFHVLSRGNARQDVFLDPTDYRYFLRILAEIKLPCSFRLYAFCLMPNHFHLLIEVSDVSLSVMMQRLLTRYSVYFNHRHDRSGHVFQGRYKAILCDRQTYLLELLRYIHLNPVRAYLSEDPAAWPWSSHREYVQGWSNNRLIDSSLPLSLFHSDNSAARTLYKQFIWDARDMGHVEAFYPSLSAPYLGNKDNKTSQEKPPVLEQRRKTLEEIGQDISTKTQIQLQAIKSILRSKPIVAARWILAREATKEGYTQKEIADFLGCDRTAVCKALSSRKS
jgi:REP element-mobilizing transposase RayT